MSEKYEFPLASAAEWQLGSNIGTIRKRRLIEMPFENIVRRIVNNAELCDYGRNKIRKFPGSWRAWVKLILPSQTVDLFHNGAGGYRAAFYLSIEHGAAANRYLINCLLEKLESQCRARPKRGCPWDFVAASLSDADAKAWIHQGVWSRLKKVIDRNLQVDHWAENARKLTPEDRKLAVWAQLTPLSERGLDIKGGCVDENLCSIGKQLKPQRDKQLHLLGFT